MMESDDTNNLEELDYGLKYARKLNFTDAHYEKAMRSLGLDYDENQLLQALIDASRQDHQSRNDQPTDMGHEVFGRSESNEAAPVMASSRSRQPYEATLAGSMQDVFTSEKSSLSSACTVEGSTPSDSSSNLISFEPIASTKYNHSPSANGIAERSHKSNNYPHSVVDHSLRKIYIDGPNVAKTHGKDIEFSWHGIRICVDWFKERGHPVVKVFVPENLCQQVAEILIKDEQGSIGNSNILDYLVDNDALVKTPIGSNDDMFLIEAARLSNGVIVSNDLFREEVKLKHEWSVYVRQNRLPYIFVDDLFIPANDPLKRSGPYLDQFLQVQTNNQREDSVLHNRLYQTHSHRTGSLVNKTKIQSCNNWAFQRRSLQHTSSNQNSINPTSARQDKTPNESNEPVELVNLYQLHRSHRGDFSRGHPINRPKTDKTSSMVTSNADKSVEGLKGSSSISRRNALIKTRSHN